MFNNYAIAPGRRQDRPGRHLRARLPAAAGAADGGDHPAARDGQGRRPAGLRDPERRLVSDACDGACPGLVGARSRRHGETTLVVDPRAPRRGLHAPARRAGLQLPLRPRRRRLPRLGRAQACPATSAPPAGRDLNAPDDAGLPGACRRRSRSASRSTTTCSRSRTRPRRVRAAGLARRRRAGADASSRVWPTADWHEREAVRPDGHRRSTATRTCGGSCSTTTGRATRCARTTRSAASRSGSRGEE